MLPFSTAGLAIGAPGRTHQGMRNLPRTVTLLAVLSLYTEMITTAQGGSMADAPPLDAAKAAELKANSLREIELMDVEELSIRREVCVNGSVNAVLAKSAAEWGAAAVASPAEYCGKTIEQAVKKDWTLGVFYNQAMKQLGLGAGLFWQSDADALGTKPVELVRNIRAAADGGYTSYIDAAGKERPLACPLALEAGAAWGAANPDKVNRPGITEELAGKIVGVCYNPDITEVTLKATGQKLTVQQAGLAAGEVLARMVKQDRQTTGSTGTPSTVPVPTQRPVSGKQASAVGG